MSPGRFAEIKKDEGEKSGTPPQTTENKEKEEKKPFKREFKLQPQPQPQEKNVKYENRRYPNNPNSNNIHTQHHNNNNNNNNNNNIITTTTTTTPSISYSILRPQRVERTEKFERKSEKPETESVPHEGAVEEKKRKRELEIKKEEKEGSEKSTENSENESVRDDKKSKGLNDEAKPSDDYQTFKKRVPWVLKCGTETDPVRLAARQKQIDFGKNTLGYQEYTKQVPRSRRKYGDPMTPDKNLKCSKRSWDGQIRKWRRSLHNYDPKGDDGEVEINIEEAQAAYVDAKDEESEEEVAPDPREQFLTPEFVKKFGTYKEKWEDEASNEPLDSNSNSNVVESDVSLSIYDKFELL